MATPANAPVSWQPPARNEHYAEDALPNQAVLRVGAQLWSWIHARLQEPNTITGVLIVLLVMIVLLQHPLARAIGTESPPAALSGSTDTAAPAMAPVAPSSVASLGHAWSGLPDVPQRDPFQPLVGQAGVVQAPTAIGPAPQQPSTTSTGSSNGQRHQSSGQAGHGQAGPGQPNGNSGASGHQQQSGGRCLATHVVQSGDSLWSISGQDLMNHGYKSVGSAVHALYAANRKTIGPDASYLVPGQRLCLPAS